MLFCTKVTQQLALRTELLRSVPLSPVSQGAMLVCDTHQIHLQMVHKLSLTFRSARHLVHRQSFMRTSTLRIRDLFLRPSTWGTTELLREYPSRAVWQNNVCASMVHLCFRAPSNVTMRCCTSTLFFARTPSLQCNCVFLDWFQISLPLEGLQELCLFRKKKSIGLVSDLCQPPPPLESLGITFVSMRLLWALPVTL